LASTWGKIQITRNMVIAYYIYYRVFSKWSYFIFWRFETKWRLIILLGSCSYEYDHSTFILGTVP
jgi:hypothetical protein